MLQERHLARAVSVQRAATLAVKRSFMRASRGSAGQGAAHMIINRR
jgi:hypothetical protein